MSLAAEERKRRILDLLELSGRVKAKDLAVLLKVSTETIRKYLDDLQDEGKLKKVYGGAISTTFYNQEPPTMERETLNKEAKEKIGELAASIINDNDVIALDDGSTPFQLAKKLQKKRNLTIITSSINSLAILIELISQNVFTGRIIMLGGEIDPQHHRVIGELTLEMLENIYVDKYFISADGLSENGEVTSYDLSKGMVAKKLMSHSNKNILLIDHTKLNRRTHYRFAHLKDINMIVSDQKFPSEWESIFEQNNVNWLYGETEGTEEIEEIDDIHE